VEFVGDLLRDDAIAVGDGHQVGVLGVSFVDGAEGLVEFGHGSEIYIQQVFKRGKKETKNFHYSLSVELKKPEIWMSNCLSIDKEKKKGKANPTGLPDPEL
jgi:hypothetical protein